MENGALCTEIYIDWTNVDSDNKSGYPFEIEIININKKKIAKYY